MCCEFMLGAISYLVKHIGLVAILKRQVVLIDCGKKKTMSIYNALTFLAKGNRQIREVADDDLKNLTTLCDMVESNSGKALELNPFTLTHEGVEYDYLESELYVDRSSKEINMLHFEETEGDKSITLGISVSRKRGKRSIFAFIDKDYLDSFKFLLKVEA